MILIHISKKNLLRTHPDINFLVVEKLSYFHWMNFSHMHLLTWMSNSISFSTVSKKIKKQSLVFTDGKVLCSVPLNVLAPKMTSKSAKELANLHDMYMPSKVLVKKCTDIA